MLRLPDGMRDRIRMAADTNNRSMNAEIISALEKHLPPPLSPIETVTFLIADVLNIKDEEERAIQAKRAKERALELGFEIDFSTENGRFRATLDIQKEK